jgi:hypothetical protein
MINRAWIPLVIASVLASWGCDSGKDRGSVGFRVGEQIVVALPDSHEFPSEEMALTSAQVALDMVRLWRTNWHPVPDNRTAAPDGRRDKFLARDPAHPNRGVVTFTNGASNCVVSVEVQTNLLFLRCSLGK